MDDLSFDFDAAALKRLRLARGLSAHRLSRLVDCTADSILAYENGRTMPSMSMFCRLVTALGCEPNDLIRPVPSPAV